MIENLEISEIRGLAVYVTTARQLGIVKAVCEGSRIAPSLPLVLVPNVNLRLGAKLGIAPESTIVFDDGGRAPLPFMNAWLVDSTYEHILSSLISDGSPMTFSQFQDKYFDQIVELTK